jgi:hypothetical protein
VTGLPVTEGSADKLFGFTTILGTCCGICLQPFLSVVVLKAMVGMFRHIFKGTVTVKFIKAICTVLDVIRSRIYEDSRAALFQFLRTFTIEKCIGSV